MKITRVETLFSRGTFPASEEWTRLRNDVHEAVQAVDWPDGSGSFTIYPESGKKRGEGNGVKPIKNRCVATLLQRDWVLERSLEAPLDKTAAGGLDAVYEADSGIVAMEWETGNVASSHRALNKMMLGFMRRQIVGASLIVPGGNLKRYLTDRIGNFPELMPYFDVYRNLPCDEGILEVVEIEYDATSTDVPRIPKGTDGRANA